eukprot:1838314-Rhodomonas_salina.6
MLQFLRWHATAPRKALRRAHLGAMQPAACLPLQRPRIGFLRPQNSLVTDMAPLSQGLGERCGVDDAIRVAMGAPKEAEGAGGSIDHCCTQRQRRGRTPKAERRFRRAHREMDLPAARELDAVLASARHAAWQDRLQLRRSRRSWSRS